VVSSQQSVAFSSLLTTDNGLLTNYGLIKLFSRSAQS
jgi:hypothetical protein